MRKMVLTMTVVVGPDDTEKSVASFFVSNPQYAVTEVSATEVHEQATAAPQADEVSS